MTFTTTDRGAYFTSLPQSYYLSPSLYEEELELVGAGSGCSPATSPRSPSRVTFSPSRSPARA